MPICTFVPETASWEMRLDWELCWIRPDIGAHHLPLQAGYGLQGPLSRLMRPMHRWYCRCHAWRVRRRCWLKGLNHTRLPVLRSAAHTLTEAFGRVTGFHGTCMDLKKFRPVLL